MIKFTVDYPNGFMSFQNKEHKLTDILNKTQTERKNTSSSTRAAVTASVARAPACSFSIAYETKGRNYSL